MCSRVCIPVSNVEFVTGPSAQTLPALIERLQESGEPVEFVLIDADHTAAGVRGDVESVLRYRPTKRPLYVVMHDSFNPECRRGMKEAPWETNPARPRRRARFRCRHAVRK